MHNTDICGLCYNKVHTFCVSIKCVNCLRTFHYRCANLERHDVEEMSLWYCQKCIMNILPYNHYEDDTDFYTVVMNMAVDHPVQFNNLEKHVFIPFEFNEETRTPLFEIDPDYQYFNETQLALNNTCDYFIEDTFIEYYKKHRLDSFFSLFHTNVRSLPKHHNELELYLESLKCKFSLIGITETWLNASNFELYGLPGYSSINKYRQKRVGGGIALYIREGIQFEERTDISIFNDELELLCIEIDKSCFDSVSNILIILVYRIPDSNLDLFQQHLTPYLETVVKEKKLCYLLGDLNIDLLKHEIHSPTSNFLDLMYGNNMLPLITKPTRVTSTSCTLIDHMFTNNINSSNSTHQGILCTSISDHFSIFHIADIKIKSKIEDTYIIKRNINQNTANQFVSHVSQISWAAVMDSNDAQCAYTEFHKKLLNAYNQYFPPMRV